MTSDSDRAAVAVFPELQRLIDLREVGWLFTYVHDRDGLLVMVAGLRMWRGVLQADALRVKSPPDAQALRSGPDHTIWFRTGTLAEVVDGLLSLPVPQGDDHA
ncbi:hypothetical protein [Amycolatopsis nigrescens]|uniref:hypothetical protein n=1 Tax=Amycolatopsis nigrescens TaxID=381445 RepID=UPI000372E602|nr:hypothetical protein [Amycolatopsis nigrescens]